MYDVAAQAGVSIATVSRALRLPDSVRPETRRRVAAAARALRYVPSGNARGLAQRRTGVLGVWFLADDLDPSGDRSVDSLYWDEIIHGIERASWDRGYAALIAATCPAQAGELAYDVAGRVDALAVLAHDVPAEELAVIAHRVPVVTVAAHPTVSGVDNVRIANSTGIRLLIEHAVTVHGHRRALFVGGPTNSVDAAERFGAFQRWWSEAGCGVPATPFYTGDFSARSGVAAAEALLATATLPDVVMCANDQMAIGLLGRLRRAGVKVPDDVAVTGFDGLEHSAHTDPPLTTVHQPLRAIGRVAVELLAARLAGGVDTATSRTLPVNLVVRESCGCPEGLSRC